MGTVIDSFTKTESLQRGQLSDLSQEEDPCGIVALLDAICIGVVHSGRCGRRCWGEAGGVALLLHDASSCSVGHYSVQRSRRLRGITQATRPDRLFTGTGIDAI
jgi:hypothetical protein